MSNTKSGLRFSCFRGIGALALPLVVAACSQAQTESELAGAEAPESQAEDHVGQVSEALTKSIACGDWRYFPTYVGARYTYARGMSHGDSTSRIVLSYQVGFHSGTNVEFANYGDFGGYWWGAALYVSYIGYYDEGGAWRGCDNAPEVSVQTW